ncbi:MAG TPA: response regulator [Nitrososphaeraceae archaeon]|nr:response regulator [Nitrososphaeraceae archaeon]
MNCYFGKSAVGEDTNNKKWLIDLANNNTIQSSINRLNSDSKNSSPTVPEKNSSNDVPLKNNSENFCVSLIDIVGSTRIVSTIDSSKNIRNFYGTFLNSVANILKKYHAKIIKTVGDGIISYFPETMDTSNLSAFENVVKCSFAQIEERSNINSTLLENNLPTISYRVSIDYGKVERTQIKGFDKEDLFGSTVNFCSKINLFAPPNSIVMGNDLYQIMKSLKVISTPFKLEEMNSYYCGAGKFSYPLYLLSRVNQTNMEHIHPLNRSLDEIRKYVFNGIKSSRAPKILLVDDEKDDLVVLEKFLKLGGFEVNSFSNPRQALLHYANTDPYSYDLIISDIRMPEINGFQLYYKLKSIKHDAKILFATCLNIAEELLELLPEVDPPQVIQKPIEKKKFIEIVKKQIL